MSTALAERSQGRPRERSRWDPVAAGPYVLLVVAWLVLLPVVGSYVNPDGVSYATLAGDWADGRWAEAVNGYWAPLLPVLMAPLVAVGVDGLLALRLVLLAAALALLPVLGDLVRRGGGGPAAARLAGWVAAPFLACAALFGLYPDLLLALVLLLFARVVLDPGMRGPAPERYRVAALAGLLGGLAYLTKAFALPFVLAAVVVAVGIHAVAAGRRGLLRPVSAGAVAVAVTSLVAAPWVVAISVDAGAPTISTAARWNAALVAPGSRGNPLNHEGFYPPSDDGAVSAWEDPARIPVDARPDVGPVVEAIEPGQTESVPPRIANSLAQGKVAAGVLARRWLAPTLLAAAGLVLVLRRRFSRDEAVLHVGLVALAALFVAGLASVIVIERYLWFAELALLPLAVVTLERLARGRKGAFRVLGTALAVVVGISAALGLAPRAGAFADVDAAVEALEPRGLPGRLAAVEDWQRSQLLCYRLDCQYWGATGDDLTGDELLAALRTAGIDHLVRWPGDDELGLPDEPAARLPGGALLYEVTGEGLVPALR